MTSTSMLLSLWLATTAGLALADDPLTDTARAGGLTVTDFSAARGEAFHRRAFAGGKPETPSCASCHGQDPLASGRTPAGKVLDPMARSRTPTRYTDPLKREKWFRRNCLEVLGRECTAREKGDWLSHMLNR